MSDPEEFYTARGTLAEFLATGQMSVRPSAELSGDDVRYVRGEKYDRLKAQAEALSEALERLRAGTLQFVNNPARGPEDFAALSACLKAGAFAIATYRGEGGEG